MAWPSEHVTVYLVSKFCGRFFFFLCNPCGTILIDRSLRSPFSMLRLKALSRPALRRLSLSFPRQFYAARTFSTDSDELIRAPPMVYIAGEEMTRYTCELMVEKWIKPFVDTSEWETFDLSCKHRDATDDQVLHDAVAAGARIGAIFKEPTITPTAVQIKEMGLSQPLCSPNGAMRKGWNGITISRDTIMIPGLKLGFDRPVFFERHAVGGEYGAGWLQIGSGQLDTKFYPDSENVPAAEGQIEKTVHYKVDSRRLSNETNVAVVYHNPLDNVADLAHHFFSRCLKSNIVPYVVTKKTVFKWQEPFWRSMKEVFDEHYRESFRRAGLMKGLPGEELQHLISDAATMQIIRWEQGGFGMAAHNYDGDMLTDEIAQVGMVSNFKLRLTRLGVQLFFAATVCLVGAPLTWFHHQQPHWQK